MMFTESELKAYRNFRGSLEEFKSSLKIINEDLKIINIVCDILEIDKEKLNINTRKREIVIARQIIHWTQYYYTYKSLSSIGNQVGNKNHATVLHSIRTINDLIDTDKFVRLIISKIEQKIKIAEIQKKSRHRRKKG